MATPRRTVLGNALRIARTDRRLSQTTLGNTIGEAQSTISSWEAGKTLPNLLQVVALAQTLDIDHSALLDAVASDAAAIEPAHA